MEIYNCEFVFRVDAGGTKAAIHNVVCNDGLKPPSPYARWEISKRNDYRSFWICVWGKLSQGNHIIIVLPAFRQKTSFSKCFPSQYTEAQKLEHALIRKDGLVWTVELTVEIKGLFSWRISVESRTNRRNKAPFSWRIGVDGRPSRRNKATFSNLYLECYIRGLSMVFECISDNRNKRL